MVLLSTRKKEYAVIVEKTLMIVLYESCRLHKWDSPNAVLSTN